jgi:hypothetical protein
MTEEMDLWSRSVPLSYAVLRIALGLNICMPGIVRWAAGLRSFAESLLAHVPEDPSAHVVRLQLRLLAANRRSNSRCLRTFWFPDSARLDFGLGSHAYSDVRVHLARRLADGRNPAHLFRGLFSIAREDSVQFLWRRPASSSQVSAQSRITSAEDTRRSSECRLEGVYSPK